MGQSPLPFPHLLGLGFGVSELPFCLGLGKFAWFPPSLKKAGALLSLLHPILSALSNLLPIHFHITCEIQWKNV